MAHPLSALTRRVNGQGALRAAERIGRPLGDERFLDRVERLTDHSLRPGKRGQKPKELRALPP
jgi:hypothetical protein